MDANQKINQIMQTLQMREEGAWVNGIRTMGNTVIESARTNLIAALVDLLIGSDIIIDQKCNLIIQALQMREEGEWINGMRTMNPTITGKPRQILVDKLVTLLTASE